MIEKMEANLFYYLKKQQFGAKNKKINQFLFN